VDFITSFLILISSLYFQSARAHPDLVDCGKDGKDGVAQAYCSDNHRIIKWEMGTENFEKFHRFPTDSDSSRARSQAVRKSMSASAAFVYASYTQEESDLERWKTDHQFYKTDGCLTWGPYVEIPKQADIEYEADIFASIPRQSWIEKKKGQEETHGVEVWPEGTVMFQLELYADGTILDKVVMNWEKYYSSQPSSLPALFLNNDGILKNSFSPVSGGFYKVRGTYKSTEALKNVEVRICRFYPSHQFFVIKTTSLKATYN